MTKALSLFFNACSIVLAVFFLSDSASFFYNLASFNLFLRSFLTAALEYSAYLSWFLRSFIWESSSLSSETISLYLALAFSFFNTALICALLNPLAFNYLTFATTSGSLCYKLPVFGSIVVSSVGSSSLSS